VFQDFILEKKIWDLACDCFKYKHGREGAFIYTVEEVIEARSTGTANRITVHFYI
jgi:hypothetical protein